MGDLGGVGGPLPGRTRKHIFGAFEEFHLLRPHSQLVWAETRSLHISVFPWPEFARCMSS